MPTFSSLVSSRSPVRASAHDSIQGRRRRWGSALGALAALLTMGSLPAAAETVFFDGEFIDTDWSTFKIYDQTVGETGIVTALRVPTGGPVDDGAYRSVRHQWTGPGSVTFAHVNASAVYDPSMQGPICRLDFACDLRAFAGPGGAFGYLLLLQQNGSYYTGTYNLTTLNEWVHFQNNGLTAAQFTKIGSFGTGGANPDFTFGGPISFGFATSTGSGSSGPSNTVSGIDNWSVTVFPCATPVNRTSWGTVKNTYR